MDKVLVRKQAETGLSEAGFNPAGRFAWLVAPVRKPKARWFFSKRQTRWIFWALAGLAAIVVLMIWPVLPPDSPAWLVYWLHDTVVSPVVGRIFLRYSPYPELIFASLLVLALLALYARSFAGDLHRLATYRALDSRGFGGILVKWANARGKDSYLHAFAERRFLEAFQLWHGSHSPKDYNRAMDAGIVALDILSKTSAAGDRHADMALAGLAARLIVMQRLAGKPWPVAGDHIVKVLSDDGKDMSKGLLSLFGDTDQGEEALRSFWERGKLWPEEGRTQYWDTVCWMAAVHALRQSDSFILHYFLTLLAEYGFEADCGQKKAYDREDRFGIDPALWQCLEPENIEIGTGPGADALAILKSGISAEVKP